MLDCREFDLGAKWHTHVSTHSITVLRLIAWLTRYVS